MQASRLHVLFRKRDASINWDEARRFDQWIECENKEENASHRTDLEYKDTNQEVIILYLLLAERDASSSRGYSTSCPVRGCWSENKTNNGGKNVKHDTRWNL